MGTCNSTKTTILKIVFFILLTTFMMIQVFSPFAIRSDSFISKSALGIFYMTYCIMNAAFGDYGLASLIIYFLSAVGLIVSYILILKGKYIMYTIPFVVFLSDFIFLTIRVPRVPFGEHLTFGFFVGMFLRLLICLLCIVLFIYERRSRKNLKSS